MHSSDNVYAERGLGQRQGAGVAPALVVVDLNYAFTAPQSPLHCSADEAVSATASLLDAARAGGRPVAFTTLEYDAAGRQVAHAFLAKVPALLMLEPGTRWPQIDDRIAPGDGEPVLCKLFASAFFGTPLVAMLAAQGCDTVVVCGASTSGCVRATVVDALQYGYRVVVPREAVCDRDPAAHRASLTDISMPSTATSSASARPRRYCAVSASARAPCRDFGQGVDLSGCVTGRLTGVPGGRQ